MKITFDSVKKLIEKITPPSSHLQMRFYWNYLINRLDKEMFYVNSILKNKRTFIDIGANVGIYSYYFSNKFDSIESFEPFEEISNRIASLGNLSIRLHNIALAEADEIKKIYIPIVNNKKHFALAGLNPPKYQGYEERYIRTAMLDSYNFSNVDLIKIDVEGYELEVIKGGVSTIKNNKPILIIEIEQRHQHSNNIYSIFDFILDLGYEGYFFRNGKIKNLSDFSYEYDQLSLLSNTMSRDYINNFIFTPK